MAITIEQMKDHKFQKLLDLAIQVDNSFNGETKGNKIIDDCEMSVFLAQVETNGLGNEYEEFLKINKQTSNTEEVVDSTNKKEKEKFNVDEAYTKVTQLEKNVKAAKTKVNNLREKLKELENTPNYKEKYQEKGRKIGSWILGGGCALATVVSTLKACGDAEGALTLLIGAPTSYGAAFVGALIGLGIGTAVYKMSKSDDEEKAYNDNRNNQIEKVRKDLKDAKIQLRNCELELQDFNDNM